MKKIISFSLWGDNPKYTQGAIENLKLQKKLLPDWDCKFHVHDSVPQNIIDKLNYLGTEIEFIHEDTIGLKEYSREGLNPGWFWRFKILNDKSIDKALIRDTDCRLEASEIYLIREWENSEKEFHLIRNHKMHGVPILAGLWGFTSEFAKKIPELSVLYDDFLNNPKHQRYGGYDQQFLGEMIYPLLDMDKTMIHDSHHHYSNEKIRPIFTLPNDSHFIGKDYEI